MFQICLELRCFKVAHFIFRKCESLRQSCPIGACKYTYFGYNAPNEDNNITFLCLQIQIQKVNIRKAFNTIS